MSFYNKLCPRVTLKNFFSNFPCADECLSYHLNWMVLESFKDLKKL